ncbi:amp dependent CoA ligase [Flammula alnicola]|nr:amp dependent CoA ligase [Flammula alnicola]
MSEFRSPVPLSHIPDDLSIPQFILRTEAPGRPVRPRTIPFFIEDGTGRAITYEQARYAHYRAYGLANALSLKWNTSLTVCLFSPNHIDYATVVWAVHILGGIVTPANPSYTADELKHQLSTTRAKVLVAHPICLTTARTSARACGISDDFLFILDSPSSSGSAPSFPTLEELIAFGWSQGENYKAIRFRPGEARTTIAFLSFSSGTTGKPKAVAISHYAVIANVIQMATHYRLGDPSWHPKVLGPGDVALGVLPFFHIYGLVVIMHYVLYTGASILVMPKFNFTNLLESITRHRITHLYLVPPMCVLLCKHSAAQNYDFSHVKFCLSGAAPLGGDLMAQMTTVFPNASIGQGYGLTETSTGISALQNGRKLGTIGSSGELLPGIVAKVVKPDGSLAAEGEPGELLVKGPAMAMGYYENPAATAETFIDGWVRTGDEVAIKNLEVYVLDRIKEIMKVRGFQVAPAELEAHLLLHPDVTDACVVGIPDDYSGEVPLAFVVPSANALERMKASKDAENEIKKAIEKHISDAKVQYKWLAGGVEFVDAIPKNPSGKILRRVLREKAKTMVRSKPPRSKL